MYEKKMFNSALSEHYKHLENQIVPKPQTLKVMKQKQLMLISPTMSGYPKLYDMSKMGQYPRRAGSANR